MFTSLLVSLGLIHLAPLLARERAEAEDAALTAAAGALAGFFAMFWTNRGISLPK